MSIKIRKINSPIEFEVEDESEVRAVLRVLENMPTEKPNSPIAKLDSTSDVQIVRNPPVSQSKHERAKDFLRWLLPREDPNGQRPKQFLTTLMNSEGPVRDTELLEAIGAQGHSSKQILGGVVQALGRNLARRAQLTANEVWVRQAVNVNGDIHSEFTLTPEMRRAMQEVMEEGYS